MQLAVLLFAFALCIFADRGNEEGEHDGNHDRSYYAHIWTAGDSDTNPDALVTVDYTVDSHRYGQVTNVAKITAGPTRKLHGNAPHHIGQSGDGRWIVAGGLLSFFVTAPVVGPINGGNKDDVFLFLVGEDHKPTFHSSYDLPGGCTDEFHYTGENTWIVSQMCDDFGNAPGGLYKFTAPCRAWPKHGCSVAFATWSNFIRSGESTLTGFNPHGGEYHPEKGFIISDFVWPASLLNSFTKGFLQSIGDNVDPLTFRGTVRHFDTHGNFIRTFNTPTAPFTYSGNLGSFTINVNIGLMQAKFFPRTNGRYAFASGTFLNYNLFLIDLTCAAASTHCTPVTPVYDWSVDFPGTILSTGIPHVDAEHSAILSTVGMKHLGLIGYRLDNTGKPTNFRKRDGIDFGTIDDGATPQWPTQGYPGSHYVAVLEGRRTRAVVINSFVDFPVNPGYICGDLLGCPNSDQQPGFMYNFHGARTVASVFINDNWTDLTLDTNFHPDLGGRTPHSVTITRSGSRRGE